MTLPFSSAAAKGAALVCLLAFAMGFGFDQVGALKTAASMRMVGLFLPVQILAASAAERAPAGLKRTCWVIANVAVLIGFLMAGSWALAT
jgi:hypothetical protein